MFLYCLKYSFERERGFSRCIATWCAVKHDEPNANDKFHDMLLGSAFFFLTAGADASSAEANHICIGADANTAGAGAVNKHSY